MYAAAKVSSRAAYGLALAFLVVGAILLAPGPSRVVRVVTDPPMNVLLTTSDIPDAGWGERASGMNGSGAWRVFAAHSEVVIATFNVTLWVEPDATAARARMVDLTRGVVYATQDGEVPGADASVFWSYTLGRDAGILVVRYNVVFEILGTSETPMSLTKSDLGAWSGWQLQRIESLAR